MITRVRHGIRTRVAVKHAVQSHLQRLLLLELSLEVRPDEIDEVLNRLFNGCKADHVFEFRPRGALLDGQGRVGADEVVTVDEHVVDGNCSIARLADANRLAVRNAQKQVLHGASVTEPCLATSTSEPTDGNADEKADGTIFELHLTFVLLVNVCGKHVDELMVCVVLKDERVRHAARDA